MKFYQKVIYGLPEGVSQLIIGMVGFYAMYFYSDVFLVDPAIVGVIFFIARILSCITDPGVGMLLDSKNGKKRRFTPFMLFGCVLMGISITLVFAAPGINNFSRVCYVAATYILYNTAYSFFEVPYGGILTTLTKDYREVNSAGSIRSFLGAIGIAGIGYFADFFMDVFSFSSGRAVNEYTFTALMLGIAIIVSGVLLKLFVPEKFVADEEAKEEKRPLREVLRLALANKPLMIVVGTNFLTNFAWLLRDSSTIYYFTYVAERPDVLSLYIALAGFLQLPVIALLPSLTGRFGNRRVIISATVLSFFGFALLIVLPFDSIAAVMASAALSAVGWSTFYGLMFGMIANTVEYGEWKNRVRTAGISTSLPLLAFKLAMGVSGLVLGFLLDVGGYVAGVVQSSSAITAINAAFIYIPFGLSVLWLILVLFYDLDAKYPEIVKELESRRSTTE